MPQFAPQVLNPDKWEQNIEKRLAKWKEKGDMSVMPRITVIPSFIARIMDRPLLANFKTPTIKKFNGVGDLREHIMAYQAAMMAM